MQFAPSAPKTKRPGAWLTLTARIAVVLAVPATLCALWLTIADVATLQRDGFIAGIRSAAPVSRQATERSLISAALIGTPSDTRPLYEALYPAQTTQFVALLLLPELIDELQGDVRADHVSYVIDERLPVVVREYVHDAPLCNPTEERLIMGALAQPGIAVVVCRPVTPEKEKQVVAWLTAALQQGFNAPQPEVYGFILPLRVETNERLVYTRFSQMARSMAVFAALLWGVMVASVGIRGTAALRWLGASWIMSGLLGVCLRAVSESPQVIDSAALILQYSQQTTWTGLPVGVLLLVLTDTAFRDWSMIGAVALLFAGTLAFAISALPPRRSSMTIGDLTPIDGIPSEHDLLHPSITGVVPTATDTDALPVGMVTNPLDVIDDAMMRDNTPTERYKLDL